MQFNSRIRYGIRLMLHLAMNYKKEALQLNEIARIEDISERYLSQIVISLKGAGLIQSKRGALGGYYLSREPSFITLREIVEALGKSFCGQEHIMEDSSLKSNQYIVAELEKVVLNNIRDSLESITLKSLLEWKEREIFSLTYEI